MPTVFLSRYWNEAPKRPHVTFQSSASAQRDSSPAPRPIGPLNSSSVMMPLAIISLGVSYCQRANQSSSSVTLSVFCSVGHCRSSRVFPATVAQLQKVILVRFSGEIGRSWPVGCICEVIGLLCRRTVPRTFYVRENQILKRGPQLPQSDSAVTINGSGTVIALLSSSVRDAK